MMEDEPLQRGHFSEQEQGEQSLDPSTFESDEPVRGMPHANQAVSRAEQLHQELTRVNSNNRKMDLVLRYQKRYAFTCNNVRTLVISALP
jgi:hypothetical protein